MMGDIHSHFRPFRCLFLVNNFHLPPVSAREATTMASYSAPGRNSCQEVTQKPPPRPRRNPLPPPNGARVARPVGVHHYVPAPSSAPAVVVSPAFTGHQAAVVAPAAPRPPHRVYRESPPSLPIERNWAVRLPIGSEEPTIFDNGETSFSLWLHFLWFHIADHDPLNRLLKPKARTDRGRSDSPAVQPQNGFGQTSTNPFSSQSFNFTAPQTNGGSFQFGQTAPAPANPPQQNGMNPSFSQSSAPAFGGFGATATQPQQNGFGGSNSMFNQPSQQSTTTSFSGFGQSQPSQQNGTTTPGTSFGGFSNASQPTNQNGNGTGMGGSNIFGQQPQQNGSNGSRFGQQAQENGASRASTPGFGSAFPAQAPEQTNAPASNIFGSQPQANGTTGNSIFGQQQAPAAKPFSGFNLGGQQQPAQNSSNSTFPASQPQEQAQTPKPSSSMFGQPPSTQPAAATTSLFGSTPAPTTSAPATSLFSSTPAPTASAPGAGLFGSTPAPTASALGTGLFGSKPTTSEPAKSSGSVFDSLPKKDLSKVNFSSSDPKQVYNGEDDNEDETSGASTDKATENQRPNPFANFPAPASAAKPASNLFGNSAGKSADKPASNVFAASTGQQDTSMSTPAATPQKSLFSNGSSTTAPVSSTPAAQPPRSLFDRIDKPQPAETPKASLFSSTPAPASTARPLFSSGSAATPAQSLFQKPSAEPEDDATPKAPAPKSMFAQSAFAAPSTPAVAPIAPAVSFKAPPATAPVARTFTAPASTATASSSASATTTDLNESQKKSMADLNKGLVAHLQSQKDDADWSAIFRYALVAAAQIAGRSAPSDTEMMPAPAAQKTSSQLFGNAPANAAAPSSNTSTAATTASAPANNPLARFAAQTPKAAPSASLFDKAPATAPSKKRSFEEDADDSSRAPATEKRSKPNEPAAYPKLPETASNTAKLFASTLDKPAESATPKATSGFTPSTKPLFSASASTSAPTPAFGGFKPTLSTTATPSAGGFKPTLPAAAAPGNSFLSSFGALAKKNEEVERQKRKDADYDSDEETEEQWAKRDAAEQEEKRKKFAEAAKSVPSFTIESATPKPATAATVEKAQGTGDKTWTPETPLQFGNGTMTNTPAAAPPKFGSAFSGFGTSATPNASSTLAPTTTSSLNASRATTPGVTTDGESSNPTNGDKATAADDGEPSDEPNQPQASEEINDLQPAEREANEVLLEVQDVRTSKMEKDEESGKQQWKPKTRGRFFILKDKTTGKVRMLSRTGAGRTVLNHVPNKEATFKVHPKKATMIVASLFVDHMHSTPPGPGQWMFSTSDKDDAEKIARLLTEGTPK